MGIIDEDMRTIVESAKLGFVATICDDGSPNLSPKGTVHVYDDDHLVFMDQASPTTIADLRRDPRLEVNVVDFLKRRGYRFKGTAELRPPGDEAFDWLHRRLLDTQGAGYPAHQVVLVHVEQAMAVDSPAYVFGHPTETELVRTWATTYAVGTVEHAGEESAASL